MTRYWDSSALIAALHEEKVYQRLRNERGVTRMHSFSEVFSTLTGGRLGMRFETDAAAKMIRQLASHLKVVDLGIDQCFAAFDSSKSKGVRGGRIHDYLHAVAAMENSCSLIYTLNRRDFVDLFDGLEIVEP